MDGQVVTAAGRRRRSALVALALLAAGASLSDPARAADAGSPGRSAGLGCQAPSSDRRALEARRACAAGRVEQGIELLAQIIAETGDPNAVYNQARCYQGNGRPEQALTRFREYLRIADGLRPRERGRIRRFIAELEREVEVRRRKGISPPPPPAPAATAALPAAGDPLTLEETGVSAAGVPDERAVRSYTLRVVALATAAAAVVPLVGAIFFARQAARIEDEIENQAPPISPADFDRKIQKGKRAETMQWVGFGLGGAMIAGAGTLYLLSRRGAEPARAQVTVAPLPGGGGAFLSGRF
jgi:hypothetical protein